MTKESQQQANMLSTREKPVKARHRASVACCACRERRTRCVVPTGSQQCVQCKDAGQDCIIKHDDERRKPNSKAYVNSLRDRISQLEHMLDDKATQSSPELRQDSGYEGSLPEIATSHDELLDCPMPEVTENDYTALAQQDVILDGTSPAGSAFSCSSNGRSTMSKLLSTQGHLGFDQLSGRLRWFGGTYNIHVLSDLTVEAQESNRQAMEQSRRTQRVLSTLSQETQEYLMDRFFQHYNSVIHIIHEAMFKEGMAVAQGKFYSPFLHITILAMGFRHADKNRPDIIRISLPGKESTLHREAKYMLDYELERPGGVTSIQALLLLGDLECGVGRDNLGWLISGMAMRILFDAGLHLANPSGLDQSEIEIGRMTLWACVIYDRYWALFLGRPTALKPDDIEVYRLAQQFERLGTLEPAGPGRTLEKQIYEALLDLMEMAGKITDIMDKASRPNVRLEQHVYVTASALTHELEAWYARLPIQLQWLSQNIEGAPASFFLLHQQYHAAIILLHRQFAQYDDLVSQSSEHRADIAETQESGHFATLSRIKCTKSAGRMAQIFWQHRQSHNMKHIFVTGLQHAGTAAIALIAAVASPKDRASRDTNMRYLECLTASIEDMSEAYQPAQRMTLVLKAVLEEIKTVMPPSSKSVPARRGSITDPEAIPQSNAKRHQTSRPGANRATSHQKIAPVFLNEQKRRHTTTDMPPPNLGTYEHATIPTGTNFPLDGLMPSTADAHISFESDLFSLCENAFSQEFNQPVSPSPLRSAWMGATTPSFSPMPTGSAGPSFVQVAMTDNPEHVRLQNPQAAQSDISAGQANLDFMTLLNPAEQNQRVVSFNDETSGENYDSQARATHKQQGFDFVSTPISLVSEQHGKGDTETAAYQPLLLSSRPLREKDTTISGGTDESGNHTNTMAGLDDIWKEMMRTNQTRCGQIL